MNSSQFLSRKIIFIGLGGILLLLILVSLILTSVKQSQSPKLTVSPSVTITPAYSGESATSSPVPTVEIPTRIISSAVASSAAEFKDPIDLFRQGISSADYRITVDITETNPNRDVRESRTAYTKKGKPVRIEEQKTTTIYKESFIYTLFPTEKKYSVSPNPDLNQPEILSFIPSLIVSKTAQGQISWKKERTNEWVGIWYVNPVNPNAFAVIQITIDEKTGLMQKMTVTSNATKSAQIIELKYQPISDGMAYAAIPPDYSRK